MFKKFLLVSMVLSVFIAGCSSETQNNTQDKVQDTTLSQEIDTKDDLGDVRVLVDMLGREVEIPNDVQKVYSTDPVGAIYLYHINPENILGWNYEPTDEEKVLLLEEYHDLNTYGMGGSTNYEAIIAGNPDVCIVSFETPSENLTSTIENLETTLEIPVIAVKSSLLDSAEAYRLLGELVSQQEQAEKLALYVENMFETIVEIPQDEQKTLYFGNGLDSLETAPIGSTSAQEFEILHISNVAFVEDLQSNRVNISSEEIIAWNPEIIIVNGDPNDDYTENQAVLDILQSPIYENVLAVTNEDVYGVPKSPFSFISRPTGPNRLMGIQWLKCVVYPEYYDLDLFEVTQEFYSLFYHIDLTEEQLTELFY